MRPAISRLAVQLDLTGAVANSDFGVTIEIEGSTLSLDKFSKRLSAALPPGAVVHERRETEQKPRGSIAFEIGESESPGIAAPAALVPPDRAVCAACLAELHAPDSRRYQDPFLSCTHCGPRYSIARRLPFDRERTSLASFSLCGTCLSEYADSADRRFHSQTITCAACGPHLWFTSADSRKVQRGDAALEASAALLQAGRILALKGLGGYQLLVLATDDEAVTRLRQRKGRASKPLAVMTESVQAARRIVELSDAEESLLTSPSGPIVVAQARPDANWSPSLAGDLDSYGVLLPTTPLHALLLSRIQAPLVCTSGNREGEPLAANESSAEEELAGIADGWLHHDRPIVRPVDDSVVRVLANAPCYLRVARGVSPLPLPVGGMGGMSGAASEAPRIVALGGQQKNALAVANGSQAVLGPHLGDLEGLAGCRRWEQQLLEFTQLYGVDLNRALLVHDSHPEYFTSIWAAARSNRSLAVQHHHAHIAAVALEHGLLHREVLGLAWDGTGWGPDGTIWGGEALLVRGAKYRRIGWLSPFALPGGELAVQEPWRVAVALVHQAAGERAASELRWGAVSRQQLDALISTVERYRGFPQCSSMGRLFDAVAALVLGCAISRTDGLAAMRLEAACDLEEPGAYSLPWSRDTGQIATGPVIRAILADREVGLSPGRMAMRFHRGLAALAIELAAAHQEHPLVLSGGVFQNRVLVELIEDRIGNRAAGCRRAVAIPPGDGGLAAGQLAVALLKQGE